MTAILIITTTAILMGVGASIGLLLFIRSASRKINNKEVLKRYLKMYV